MTDNPQPGPALDEEILRLLGWKRTYETGATYGIWQSPDGAFHKNPPPISTDDATALAMLEQLNKPVEEGGKGLYVEISLFDSKGRIREVLLTNLEVGSAWFGEGETIAHAAALAMLAALEAEK